MGKRIPFIISTLLLLASWSLMAAPPTSAKEVVINDTRYWTYDEVLKESEKFLEHRTTICSGNRECESYLGTAYTVAGGKYSAARIFIDYYFMITAIDPENSTIKVLFQDDAAGESIGNRDKDTLKNLYLFWWENGEPEIRREVYTGEIINSNRREIYTYRAKENEERFSGNIEVKIPLSKTTIEVLKNKPIYWGAESELSNAFSSGRHFESCLTEIEGREGYECRAVFDEMGNIIYHPTEKISTSIIGVPETTPETTPETVTKIITEVVTKTVPEIITETVTDTNHVEVPLAAKNSEENHEFPWWFILFIFSGIFLIIWWSIPTKKVQKNS